MSSTAGAGQDAINGGAGNDTIRGGANSDTITQLSTDGRDIIDGGTTALAGGSDTSSDTYVLNGVAAAETFNIYTRAAGTPLRATTLASLAAGYRDRHHPERHELRRGHSRTDNIEEIQVNTHQRYAPIDGGGLNGGTSGGDTFQVIGDFTAEHQPAPQHHHDRWRCRRRHDRYLGPDFGSSHRVQVQRRQRHHHRRPAAEDVIELPEGRTVDDYGQTVPTVDHHDERDSSVISGVVRPGEGPQSRR